MRAGGGETQLAQQPDRGRVVRADRRPHPSHAVRDSPRQQRCSRLLGQSSPAIRRDDPVPDLDPALESGGPWKPTSATTGPLSAPTSTVTGNASLVPQTMKRSSDSPRVACHSSHRQPSSRHSSGNGVPSRCLATVHSSCNTARTSWLDIGTSARRTVRIAAERPPPSAQTSTPTHALSRTVTTGTRRRRSRSRRRASCPEGSRGRPVWERLVVQARYWFTMHLDTNAPGCSSVWRWAWDQDLVSASWRRSSAACWLPVSR